MDTCTRSKRSWALESWVALSAVGLGSCAWFRDLTIDDAFITYRQAERLASGDPSFNTGERVEATSSALHTLLLALAHSFGANTAGAARALGYAAVLATAGAYVSSMRSILHRGAVDFVALAPFLVTLSGASIGLWWVYGLETPIWMTLVVALAVSARRQSLGDERAARVLTVAAAGLAAAVRPEAAMVVTAWGVSLGVVQALPWRRVAAMVAAALGVFVALGVLRLTVYGQWFPTPVYVKTGASLGEAIYQGVYYVVAHATWDLRKVPLRACGYLTAVALTSAPWAAAWYTALRERGLPALRPALPALLLGTTLIGFTVMVGGDWMPRGRFLVPVYLLAPLALTAIPRARSVPSWVPALGAFVAVIVMPFTHMAARETGFLSVAIRSELTCQRPIARYLEAHARAGDRLAAADIGIVGYRFPGDIVDYCGLANPALAHTGRSTATALPSDVLRGEPAWVLAYAADRVTSRAWPTAGGFAEESMSRLASSRVFRARYRVAYQCQADVGRWHVLFEMF